MKLNFNQDLFEFGDLLVAAISGGVDSMVLLHELNQLKKIKFFEIHVAHMNHHKRPSSAEDEAFVREVSTTLGFQVKSFDFIDSKNENFQSEARNQRYKQFCDYAKSVGATKLVLAHHLDDQAETILMRLARGTSFQGYGGMRARSTYKGIEVLRPLLEESKENIIAYAKEKKIEYRQDESNETDDYTRNRYRHNILPLLKEENNKALEKISRFSRYLFSAHHLVEQHALEFIRSYTKTTDNQVSVSISPFLKEEPVVQSEVILKIVNQVSNNRTELSEKNIEEIKELFLNEKPNIEKRISAYVTVIREYDHVKFSVKPDGDLSYEFKLADFGEVILPTGERIAFSSNRNIIGGKPIDLWYNNIDFLFPITVRTRREKDSLSYPFGTRKLKDVLIDRKVPMNRRNSLPIVTDSKGLILFIPEIYTYKEENAKNRIQISYSKG